MKHTKLLRLYSAVLVFTIILSSVFIGQKSFMASAEDGSIIIPTAYEVEANKDSAWDVYYENGSLTTEFEENSIISSGTGTKILTLKSDVLKEDSTLKSISFDIESNTDYAANIVYATENDKLLFLQSKNVASGMYTTSVDKSGSVGEAKWNYVGADFASMLQSHYIKVSVVFSGTQTVVTMATQDGSYTRSFSFTDKTSIIGLYLTNKANIRNLEVTATRPVDYAPIINQFSSTYSTLLNSADITLSDKETLKSAVSEFSALPKEVRSAYYDIELTLEAFERKIAALEAGQDYDLNSLYELKNWEAAEGHLSLVKLEEEKIILEPTVSEGEGSSIILSPKESALCPNGEAIKKFSYTVLKGSASSERGWKIIYDYADAENFKYLNIWQSPQHGIIAQYNTMVSGTSKTTQTATWLDIDLSAENTVSLDYSSGGSVVITISGAGKRKTFSFNVENDPKLLIASTKLEKMTFSNFEVVKISEDEAATENKAINNYKEKHNEILCLTDNMIAVNYKDEVALALAEFETLSDYAKTMLQTELAHLNSLKAKIGEMESADTAALPERASNDYNDFYDDFENGLNKWSNYRTSEKAPELIYNSETDNTYVSLSGSAIIGPNSFSYPDKAFVKSFSYKFKSEQKISDIFYSIKIYIDYVDAENYDYICIYRASSDDSKLSYRINSVTNGVQKSGTPSQRSLNCNYDMQWLDISISYTTTGKATISISDGKQTDLISASSKQQGRPALGGMGLNDSHRKTGFFDDVSFSMQAGTWTDNIDIENINIYYTGNTSVEGDDVVILQGEQLYDTLAKAYILKLDDLKDNFGYIKQTDFSSAGKESAYIAPKDAAVVWNTYAAESEPSRLKLIQHNDSQVKFIIPEELGKGIFAVKLEGFDNLSSTDDTVIYINLPKVSYVQGTDGKTVTPGGTLRIMGENLALYDIRTDSDDYIDDEYQSNAFLNENVRVMLKNGSNEYILENSAVSVKSEQYLYATLPTDIAEGEYEIFVYNGYGDNSCWSMPCENTVTVGKAPYETWKQTVFNVKSFGATGVNTQNATGYVLDALTAAAENGGGIVYFPKGVYNLIHSIIIPENVQIVGEGVDKSVILWTPDQWKWYNCPSYLCAVTNNVVFKDIAFYGTRTNDVFRNYGGDVNNKNENIYFVNVRLHFNAIAGNITGGDTTATDTGMTNAEMKTIAEDEAANKFALLFKQVKNLRIDNLQLNKQCGRPAHLSADDLYVGNTTFNRGWQTGGGTGNIYEYVHFDFITVGYTVNKCMTYGCFFDTRIDNNRELFVADGSPRSTGGKSDVIIKKDTSDPTGKTYKILNGSWGEDKLIRYQVYVSSGQGMGQVRRVADNIGNKIVLDEAFLIEPNDNGYVILRGVREDMYFVNNHYYNGAATGYYGGFANVLYNGCLWEYVSDIYQMARDGDANWYFSYVNNTFIDSFQLHNYGYGTNDWTGFSFVRIYADSGANATFAAAFRNNCMDGYSLKLESYYIDGIQGVVIEDNVFENMDYVFSRYGGGAGVNGMDGIFLYKNSLYNVYDYLESDSAKTAVNKYGGSRYIEYATTSDYGGFIIGDVNADGKISLKDATCIKLHISGILLLTEEQLIRADFFADDSVTLRDSTAIRHYIVTGEILKPEENTSSTPTEDNSSNSSSTSSNEYFEGIF